MRLLLILSLLTASRTIEQLRVMTFNIWKSGLEIENGIEKIAKHILAVNPDIVALQEVREEAMENITMHLPDEWIYVEKNNSYPDAAILTRHSIDEDALIETNGTISVPITLENGVKFIFTCAHLAYKGYGPYAANNKLVTSRIQIMAGEEERRAQLAEYFENKQVADWLNGSIPVILAGDFNAPSHLDWMDADKEGHGSWAVSWPSSTIMIEHAFIDSYRKLYPDPVQNPGNTWSTVNKYNPEWMFTVPEPQDRIDFIYYFGSDETIQPTSSKLYSGIIPLKLMPFHEENDYPSDHFALITEFELRQ